MPEAIGDAAIMIRPHDIEDLADAMRRMLADAELAADPRARGVARAALFTWGRAARETVAVCEKVKECRR